VIGNVREWTADAMGPSPAEAQVDPPAVPGAWGAHRVARGGCWFDAPGLTRLAHRRGTAPTHPGRPGEGWQSTGLRVAADVVGPGAPPPAWFEALAPAERPPVPLPRGLAFGHGRGEYRNLKDRSVLVWVPGGAGLKGFFLGKYEVTWGQLRRFAAVVAEHPPLEPGGYAAGDRHPVFGVGPRDADAYCAWAGLALPTAAEWVDAACGRSDRPWPWGEAEPDGSRLNLADRDVPPDRRFDGRAPWRDGAPEAAPVGSYPAGASPFGCLDMAGNAWEVLAAAEPGAPKREVRGGSFASSGERCRPTKPSTVPAASRQGNHAVGFRVCRRLD